MNTLGAVAAVATFVSVWFGHVAVRKVEYTSSSLWKPTIIFATLGAIMEFFSLSPLHRPLSTALGILGITLLFDALELTRQQNRVKKGHAPANPNNPRHAKILANSSAATTQDLLKRDPIGHVASINETDQLISHL